MPIRRLAAATLVTFALGAVLFGKALQESNSAAAMAGAASSFLETLTDAQRQKATFAFDDAERLNWHFIPRERKGLPLKELEGEPLRAAHRLLASGLSNAGYDQAVNVMSLEELLYLLEGGDREERRAKRDPQKYFISVFGKPSGSGSWGWRFEGHHISLNYTVVDGKLVSTTPEFFGANPGSVDAGPGRQIRVLGVEEDLARQILKAGSAQQRNKAWIDQTAPKEVRTAGEAQPDASAPVGLRFANMNDDQKRLVRELLSEYLRNMPADVERERRGRINNGGMDDIHFAWWGGSELNQPHYYRVQGPTFLIEYNNTQNQANHVHSMWRNLTGDFNVPIKASGR